MKAIRGAINFLKDEPQEVYKKTEVLIGELIKRNGLSEADIVCVVFSTTKDIKCMYPAKVFREKFYSTVPLFSTTEPDIDGGMPLTLRILALADVKSPVPVYLYETKKLRSDLFNEYCD